MSGADVLGAKVLYVERGTCLGGQTSATRRRLFIVVMLQRTCTHLSVDGSLLAGSLVTLDLFQFGVFPPDGGRTDEKQTHQAQIVRVPYH